MLMKRLLCRSGKLTGLWLMLLISASSCSKNEAGYKKVIADIGFLQSAAVTVADTAKAYTQLELDISTINSSFAYDVYFTFTEASVVPALVKVTHATYTDPATGIKYYRAPVARGIKKAAVSFQPVNINTGDKTFSITLHDDMSGNNNYELLPGRNTVSVSFLDK